jgi:hypothetical protein
MNLVRLGGDWARGFSFFPARLGAKAVSSTAFRLEGEDRRSVLASVNAADRWLRVGPPPLFGSPMAKGARVSFRAPGSLIQPLREGDDWVSHKGGGRRCLFPRLSR